MPSFPHMRPNCVTAGSPRCRSCALGGRTYTFFQSVYSACGTPYCSIHRRSRLAAAQVVSSAENRPSTMVVASSTMCIRQAGGRTGGERRLGGALQEPAAATGAAESALGPKSESRAGAGERSGRDRHLLSRATSGLSGSPLAFYSDEQRKGRCPFPRTPIPEPSAISSTTASCPSSLETRLAGDENTSLFLGMVKPQPGDTSIVENAGTFLMWYDNPNPLN